MKIFILTCLRETVDNWEGGIDASVEAYAFFTKAEATYKALEKYLEYFENSRGYEYDEPIDDLLPQEWLKPNQSLSTLTRRLKRIEDFWVNERDDGSQVQMKIWAEEISPYVQTTSKGRTTHYQFTKKRITKKLYEQKTKKG